MTNDVRLVDGLEIGEIKKTRDGYLTARVKAARTGIQLYAGSVKDQKLDEQLDGVVRVYRPEEAVFDRASLGSFKGKPITVGHPKERVTADNHKDLSRGHISNVARDGETVALDVAITDAATVKMIEDGGPRELSAGYTAKLEWKSGRTLDGQEYDAIQRDIFVDHLAIVAAGRAGEEFRIGDDADWGSRPIQTGPIEQNKEDPMSDALNKTVQVGDGAVLTNEAGEIRIKSMLDSIDAKTKELADAKAELAKVTKDLKTRDGELAATKKSLADATSPKALADMAKKRADMMEKGKKADLDEDDMDKMSDEEIARAVVTKHLGDEWVKSHDGADFVTIADSISSLGAKTKTTDEKLGDGLKSGDKSIFSDRVMKAAGVKMRKEA